MICIIDYGVGNLFSLKSSLAHLGLEAKVSADAADIRAADRLILPGVGAFGDAMAKLEATGLVPVIREEAAKKPLLGICLGMQLLFEKSYEYGEHDGLGFVPGQVCPLAPDLGDKSLKVPQIGWNAVHILRDDPLFKYVRDGEYFYYEYSCLYRHDAYTDGERESPATYAHEILHLFGAPDLYEGSGDPYVDRALVDYVAETYPDDIMVSTYEDDGTSRFDVITKEISPLTAYCLGLTDTCPELEQFPLLTQVEPGVFRRELTADTSDETADAWPGAVAA